MKNILLLIHDDRGQNARVQAALDLGRALDGHLTCVSVTEPVVALAGDFYGASAQAVLVADASAAATENRERVEACLEGEDVPWTMTDMTGSITEALVINAALADLVVLNTGSSDRPASEVCTLAGAVLFDARKPVVAVPAGSRRFDPFAPALIAWDGSATALAATRAAVPLLRLATDVTLFEVVTGKGGTLAEDAAAYLSRHNVHAEIVREPGDGGSIALKLDQECARRGATCVMGAFGRSRLSEALFGGITRRMLTASSVPLFLAH